jgi:hypothetical protein
VVVTLMLVSWRAKQPESAAYASDLLRRVNKHVKAHVRKNPGWQNLGGGAPAATGDFCQAVVLAILEDTHRPSHAEVAFGNFVYRRCLDEAGKLYAKKHSAGQSFDEEEIVEAQARDGDPVDSLAWEQSPEALLIELEEHFAEKTQQMVQLEQIRRIVQEELPELQRLAFSFRFYGNMKIESKDKSKVTVTSLMGCTEKTASKYIKEAIEFIIKRLTP